MPTKIEWTDETWNPVTGCTKVSAGCQHCYAERMARRLAGRFGYPDAPGHFDVTLHPDRLEQPLHWRKPRMVFVCSMSDLFHEDVPFDFISRVFGVMTFTSQHTYQVLTKRPGRMLEFFENLEYWPEPQLPLPNVQLGVTAENQKAADERIPILLQIPAAVRFVSVEPMLGPVSLTGLSHKYNGVDYQINSLTGDVLWHERRDVGSELMGEPGNKINWVIAGGESGPGARPMHPDWVRSLRDQCGEAGVPFFFKQWGSWVPTETYHEDGAITWSQDNMIEGVQNRWVAPNGDFCTDLGPQGMAAMARVGKKRAGRLLDGREWNEFPEV